MNLEDIKLKARNYWRDNRKVIVLVFAAFVLGAGVAVFNFVSYENAQDKYSFEGEKPIENQKPASFDFRLENPQLARGTTLRLRFSGMDTGPPVDVFVNDRRVRRVSSGSATISLESDELKASNTVRIERVQLGFSDQALVSASVESITRFRQLVFVLLNLGSIALVAAPILYIKYKQFRLQQEFEKEFPNLLRDVLEGVRAGMSLPQAIKNAEEGGYGRMDDEVQKMIARLDWGVPFDEVLKSFADASNSGLIRRSSDTIIQAYQSGGDIEDVLDSVVGNIRSIQKLQSERESQLYGELVTGYVVYFLFIGILVGLTTYLLPSLAQASASLSSTGRGGLGFSQGLLSGSGSLQENIQLYERWFRNLAYIQAVFSGLIIGKLSEGSLRAGLKHVAILFGIGYLAVTFFL